MTGKLRQLTLYIVASFGKDASKIVQEKVVLFSKKGQQYKMISNTSHITKNTITKNTCYFSSDFNHVFIPKCFKETSFSPFSTWSGQLFVLLEVGVTKP